MSLPSRTRLVDRPPSVWAPRISPGVSVSPGLGKRSWAGGRRSRWSNGTPTCRRTTSGRRLNGFRCQRRRLRSLRSADAVDFWPRPFALWSASCRGCHVASKTIRRDLEGERPGPLSRNELIKQVQKPIEELCWLDGPLRPYGLHSVEHPD